MGVSDKSLLKEFMDRNEISQDIQERAFSQLNFIISLAEMKNIKLPEVNAIMEEDNTLSILWSDSLYYLSLDFSPEGDLCFLKDKVNKQCYGSDTKLEDYREKITECVDKLLTFL
jgi:hypothetical protein